jgi:hypothetical protein
MLPSLWWVDINNHKADRSATFRQRTTRAAQKMAPVGESPVKLSVRFQMCVEDGNKPPARARLCEPFWH